MYFWKLTGIFRKAMKSFSIFNGTLCLELIVLLIICFLITAY